MDCRQQRAFSHFRCLQRVKTEARVILRLVTEQVPNKIVSVFCAIMRRLVTESFVQDPKTPPKDSAASSLKNTASPGTKVIEPVRSFSSRYASLFCVPKPSATESVVFCHSRNQVCGLTNRTYTQSKIEPTRMRIARNPCHPKMEIQLTSAVSSIETFAASSSSRICE